MREGGPGRISFLKGGSLSWKREAQALGEGKGNGTPPKAVKTTSKLGPSRSCGTPAPYLSISNTVGDIATAFNLPPPLHHKDPGAEKSQGIGAP